LKSQLDTILQEVFSISIQVMVWEQGPQHFMLYIPPPGFLIGVGIEVLVPDGSTANRAKTSVNIMDMLPQGGEVFEERTTVRANKGSSITHCFSPPLS
jgi:hypothetical protein